MWCGDPVATATRAVVQTACQPWCRCGPAKPQGERPRNAGGGRPNGGAAAPKRNGNGNGGGGKPSWMKEISGANSDRRPVRMGE